jgi:hypothetical protein
VYSAGIYLGFRYGAQMPAEYTEWKMAFETGWTLDYIRGLSMQDVENYFQVKDGARKAGVQL